MLRRYDNKSMGPPTLVVLHHNASGEHRMEFDEPAFDVISAMCRAKWGDGALVECPLESYFRWEVRR